MHRSSLTRRTRRTACKRRSRAMRPTRTTPASGVIPQQVETSHHEKESGAAGAPGCCQREGADTRAGSPRAIWTAAARGYGRAAGSHPGRPGGGARLGVRQCAAEVWPAMSAAKTALRQARAAEERARRLEGEQWQLEASLDGRVHPGRYPATSDVRAMVKLARLLADTAEPATRPDGHRGPESARYRFPRPARGRPAVGRYRAQDSSARPRQAILSTDGPLQTWMRSPARGSQNDRYRGDPACRADRAGAADEPFVCRRIRPRAGDGASRRGPGPSRAHRRAGRASSPSRS